MAKNPGRARADAVPLDSDLCAASSSLTLSIAADPHGLAVAGKNKRHFNNGFACTPGKD
jgi:hypothetical protein